MPMYLYYKFLAGNVQTIAFKQEQMDTLVEQTGNYFYTQNHKQITGIIHIYRSKSTRQSRHQAHRTISGRSI